MGTIDSAAGQVVVLLNVVDDASLKLERDGNSGEIAVGAIEGKGKLIPSRVLYLSTSTIY